MCISNKDRKALASARKNLKVKKTYFYCVMPDGSNYERVPEKKEVENCRFSERVVDLGYATKEEIAEFKRRRREFRV